MGPFQSDHNKRRDKIKLDHIKRFRQCSLLQMRSSLVRDARLSFQIFDRVVGSNAALRAGKLFCRRKRCRR